MLQQAKRGVIRAIESHGRIRLFPTPSELRKAQLLDDELHAGLVPIFAVAQRVEHFDHRFDARDQLIEGNEFPQNLRNTGGCPQPPSDHHTKANQAVRATDCQEPNVVDGRQGAIARAS